MTYIRGKCIRCERARAHRTLLISFRPRPTGGIVRRPPSDQMDPATGYDPANLFPEWVRLSRPDPRSRYVRLPSLIYHCTYEPILTGNSLHPATFKPLLIKLLSIMLMTIRTNGRIPTIASPELVLSYHLILTTLTAR